MKKMIFLNVGWMKHYKGLTSDSIVGGGSFVDKHGYGEEIFNFLPYDGDMYGYVMVKGTINIERLGASKADESVDDVLAVWVSKSPTGGVFIVGWYKNATIYKHCQVAPKEANREYKNEQIRYHVKAAVEDCKLLPLDNRVFKIPTKGKGAMGQSNVWYADQPMNTSLRQDVLNFINTERITKNEQSQAKNGMPRQLDPFRRQKVERAAVEMAIKHYEDLGYVVDSVEKDNKGWDLEAFLLNKLLRIEVKGLSQEELLIELTPNEYNKMKKYKDSYRIVVVTKALSKKPLLKILSFSPESAVLEDEQGNPVVINEFIGARISSLTTSSIT